MASPRQDETGEKFWRRTSRWEEVGVPEGQKICWKCRGAGQISKYDEGWSSVVYEPSLAAYHDCFVCHGTGTIPAGP